MCCADLEMRHVDMCCAARLCCDALLSTAMVRCALQQGYVVFCFETTLCQDVQENIEMRCAAWLC